MDTRTIVSWALVSFGVRLRSARDQAGLSQNALAKECGWLGDGGQVRVHQYEAEKTQPSLGDIERLAEAVGLPPGELAFGTSDFRPEELALVQAWRTGTPEIRTLLANVVKMWRRPRWHRPERA